MKPVRLTPKFVERVWGTRKLSPWFPDAPEKTGEVWYTSDDNQTSEGVSLRALMEREGSRLLGSAVPPAFGGRFPILFKFLFTEEKLSVQVHPDDAYAEDNESSPGKTEMWYVLRASADATLAAGCNQSMEPVEFRQAIYEGRVEEALTWWPAKAGETYFIPATTVHAVGAGLVICEIQQNSDITYRIWDYNRPRELHVESAMAVAKLAPYAGPATPLVFAGGELLASCKYFATERYELLDPGEWHSDAERFHLIVVVRGEGTLSSSHGQWSTRQGDCWLIPSQCGVYRLDGLPELEILRVYVPGE